MKFAQQETALVRLFQSLPLEQCRKLYLQQRPALGNHILRRVLLAVIGAKSTYGDEEYFKMHGGANAKCF